MPLWGSHMEQWGLQRGTKGMDRLQAASTFYRLTSQRILHHKEGVSRFCLNRLCVISCIDSRNSTFLFILMRDFLLLQQVGSSFDPLERSMTWGISFVSQELQCHSDLKRALLSQHHCLPSNQDSKPGHRLRAQLHTAPVSFLHLEILQAHVSETVRNMRRLGARGEVIFFPDLYPFTLKKTRLFSVLLMPQQCYKIIWFILNIRGRHFRVLMFALKNLYCICSQPWFSDWLPLIWMFCSSLELRLSLF